jgi:hypothetical protein
MKRILVLAFVAAFVFSFATAMAQKTPQVVTITCPDGGDPSIGNPNARVSIGETVTFSVVCAGANGCVSGVNVSGVAPIGNFNLTPAAPQNTITFNTAGTYEYDVTKLKGGKGPSHGVVVVYDPAVPTLTQWGIIALIALVLGSAVFLMLRRKKAAVPA